MIFMCCDKLIARNSLINYIDKINIKINIFLL